MAQGTSVIWGGSVRQRMGCCLQQIRCIFCRTQGHPSGIGKDSVAVPGAELARQSRPAQEAQVSPGTHVAALVISQQWHPVPVALEFCSQEKKRHISKFRAKPHSFVSGSVEK